MSDFKTKRAQAVKRKKARIIGRKVRNWVARILAIVLIVTSLSIGYLLVDKSVLLELVSFLDEFCKSNLPSLNSKSTDIIQGFEEIRFFLWVLEAMIILIGTILYTQNNEKSDYIDAWDFASLAWTLIFSIVYLVNLAKVPSFIFPSIISCLVIFTVLTIGLLSKIGITGGFLNRKVRYLLSTYTPFALMLFFSVLDYKVSNAVVTDNISEIKKISAHLFSVVDIPFLVTILVFTLYYQIFLILLYIQRNSLADETLIGKIELQEKEVEIFFSGAISLQLISANILFAMVDCGIISTLDK
jgi:hypothetical protein